MRQVGRGLLLSAAVDWVMLTSCKAVVSPSDLMDAPAD